MSDISKSLEERVTELERSRDAELLQAIKLSVHVAALHGMTRLTARVTGISEETYQKTFAEAIEVAEAKITAEMLKAAAARTGSSRAEVVN